MKVMIISTNADEAGAPRHVESIACGMSSDYDFILVFGENGPVGERLLKAGFIVYVVDHMRSEINVFNDLIALVKIFILVIRHRPDIIHCHSAKAGMIGRIIAVLTGRRWVYTVHGWGWRGLGYFKRRIIILIERALKFLPRGKYIYVAHDVMHDAIKVVGVNAKSGVVIYNGVAPVQVRSIMGHEGYNILMPARVSSAKDHKSLIVAFELLNFPESRLFLCGEGTSDPDFKKNAQVLAPKSFGRIIFLGQCSRINEIYEQCDVVALISNFEALPLSIIEAMSCSRPVIATNTGGIPELIDHERSGILVGKGDFNAICSALKSLSERSVRSAYALLAKEKYDSRFTQEKMLDSISKLYGSR